ncbi:MAG: hypothetical protein ACRDQH_18245, partial [Pseudonocardiaceae bacterium]
ASGPARARADPGAAPPGTGGDGGRADLRMREVLTGRESGATALAGRAEEVPLPDASVDAVLVSSALHGRTRSGPGAAPRRPLRPPLEWP